MVHIKNIHKVAYLNIFPIKNPHTSNKINSDSDHAIASTLKEGILSNSERTVMDW